ncbi:hypothetical protein EDC01DRAFT_792212 [Geopyxis carbonaria]|nr:hypothetical protein EDC01DRAFT_792212 [Geopyxis carbonaria]
MEVGVEWQEMYTMPEVFPDSDDWPSQTPKTETAKTAAGKRSHPAPQELAPAPLQISTTVSFCLVHSSILGSTTHINHALEHVCVALDKHYCFKPNFLLTYLSLLELYTELMRLWNAVPVAPPHSIGNVGNNWPDRALKLLCTVQSLLLRQLKEIRTPSNKEVERLIEYMVNAGFGE